MAAELHVSPHAALAGEAWHVRVTGLEPGTRVELVAAHTDGYGIRWEARAAFEADEAGVADPSEQAPLWGTYAGVDPAGLFWSTRPVSGKPPTAFPKGTGPTEISLSAEVAGTAVASQTVRRLTMRPSVERHEVREDGVIGTLFTPAEEGPRPALIVFGGSEGGVFERSAAGHASRGFAALALGFFGLEGLPDELVEIPLETVERALEWLEGHPRVRSESIGAWGASKGAELALAAASCFPQIRAVVAKSPSAVVFEGIGEGFGRDHRSSSSFRGEPLPFVPVTFTARIGLGYMWARARKKPYSSTPMYEHALADADMVERAAIEVENINGPVLLTSSGLDGAWPSGRMGFMIMERLRAHDHPFPDVHLHYEGAGHQIQQAYTPTTVDWLTTADGMIEELGGTPEANAAASLDSTPKMEAFLEAHLAHEPALVPA